jgi:hypothetical protein
MPRRQTEVLRNLDDSLRVLNFLTLRSCGLVIAFYGLASGAELLLGLWTAFLGPAGFVAPLAAAAVVAVALSWIERHDDEHYVPSAIRYLAARPWRFVYGACAFRPSAPASTDGHRIAQLLRASRRRRPS